MQKYLFPLLSTTTLLLLSNIVQAQNYSPSGRIPAADNSQIGTIVNPTGNNNFNIDGGLRRGQNLFHSFSDFSVPIGGSANFTNPQGDRSIITRVTGNKFSDINGLVNTNGANFLLINPNGVVFGPGVSLNVGKAFVTSTASGVNLVDAQGGNYNFGVNKAGDAPLISIDPNIFFNVSSLTMGGGNGQINNFGTLQTTNDSQYIGLIGGNINLNGGKIIAPGGRVELGGLSVPGTVGLGVERNLLRAQFPTDLARGDVSLTNGSRVNVAGAGGGDIAVNANNVEILGGSILRGGIEAGLGTPEAVAGDIKLHATGGIIIDANGAIVNNVRLNSQGKGGGIEVITPNLSVTNGSQIGADTQGKGDAGKIQIIATGNISFDGRKNDLSSGTFSQVLPGSEGKGGGIEIIASNLSITNGARLNASTFGKGDSGSIKITASGNVYFDGIQDSVRSAALSTVGNGAEGKGGGIEIVTGDLFVKNGAQLNTSTFGIGDGGKLKVTASGNVYFDGRKDGFGSTALSKVEEGAEGKGGGIEIVTPNLSITNSAQLVASTDGKGAAGNIKISATNKVSFDGRQGNFRSAVFSTVEKGGEAKGGEIEIVTPNLSITNGAILNASTKGKGDAGKIQITAANGNVLFDDSAALNRVEPRAEGKGGGIEIVTGNLFVNNGAQLTASTFGIGNAGNIKINATGKVSFDGIKNNIRSGSLSEVRSGATGNGGEIEIVTPNLSVTNGAKLTVSTKGKGDAGNIKITATEGNVSFDGIKNGFRSTAISTVEKGGEGKAGGIEIVTGNLSVTNGALLTAGTFGKGDAGNIKITATGNVSFDDRKDGYSSGAFSEVGNEAEGKAGGIEIVTGNLSVTNGALLVASTYGKGDAGNIKITATENGKVSFDGNKDGLRSGAFSEVYSGAKGKGGGIEIVTPNLSITNGAALATNTFGTGNAGDIFLKSNTITLNKGEILSKSTSSTGGDINIIITDYLLLRNDSLISTDSESTGKNGNGGNITISSPLIIALPGNNDITANANQGNGGKVSITSQGLFGIQYRPKGTDFTNDITASSTFGQSGSVQIDTPGIDPAKDTGELPVAPNDASNQISQACGASQRDNKFYITGRGGLPPNAREPQESDALWEDARAVKATPATTADLPPKYAPPAIGWVFEKNGRVRLIAAQTAGGDVGTRVVCPVSSVK